MLQSAQSKFVPESPGVIEGGVTTARETVLPFVHAVKVFKFFPPLCTCKAACRKKSHSHSPSSTDVVHAFTSSSALLTRAGGGNAFIFKHMTAKMHQRTYLAPANLVDTAIFLLLIVVYRARSHMLQVLGAGRILAGLGVRQETSCSLTSVKLHEVCCKKI